MSGSLWLKPPKAQTPLAAIPRPRGEDHAVRATPAPAGGDLAPTPPPQKATSPPIRSTNSPNGSTGSSPPPCTRTRSPRSSSPTA